MGQTGWGVGGTGFTLNINPCVWPEFVSLSEGEVHILLASYNYYTYLMMMMEEDMPPNILSLKIAKFFEQAEEAEQEHNNEEHLQCPAANRDTQVSCHL